jgi:hypothetical protein
MEQVSTLKVAGLSDKGFGAGREQRHNRHTARRAAVDGHVVAVYGPKDSRQRHRSNATSGRTSFNVETRAKRARINDFASQGAANGGSRTIGEPVSPKKVIIIFADGSYSVREYLSAENARYHAGVACEAYPTAAVRVGDRLLREGFLTAPEV